MDLLTHVLLTRRLLNFTACPGRAEATNASTETHWGVAWAEDSWVRERLAVSIDAKTLLLLSGVDCGRPRT